MEQHEMVLNIVDAAKCQDIELPQTVTFCLNVMLQTFQKAVTGQMSIDSCDKYVSVLKLMYIDIDRVKKIFERALVPAHSRKSHSP